jgi:hypothetical protein
LTNCYSSSSLANGASSSSTLSANNCSKWSVNNYNSTGVNPEWTGTPPGSGTMIKTAYSYDSFNGSTSSPSGSTNRKCVRKEIATPYDSNYTGGSGFTFAEWEYKPRALDVSGYLTGTATLTPSETNGSKSTWAGCIEERDTDSSINTGTNSISSNAHDLNIDEIPSNNNNKWRPSWKEVIYLRNSASDADPTVTRIGGGTPVTNQGSDSYACPTEAKRLQAWTRSDLSTYLNSLNADGYTYHDIGMIWGGRFISPDGIFGGDNPSTYNSMPVARFIIYMTDGALNTVETGYSSYGVEYLDKRVTGGYTTSSDQDNRHNQRFALACQAAKAKGVSIWVVAFASSLSTQLQNCASKTTQASVSSDSASLIAKFAEIGKNIGSLRLTQ